MLCNEFQVETDSLKHKRAGTRWIDQNGVSGILLRLLDNYLRNRKQCVVLNGSFSDYSLVNSGDPQGSVLYPFYS